MSADRWADVKINYRIEWWDGESIQFVHSPTRDNIESLQILFEAFVSVSMFLNIIRFILLLSHNAA